MAKPRIRIGPFGGIGGFYFRYDGQWWVGYTTIAEAMNVLTELQYHAALP